MEENFPNLKREMPMNIQEAYRTPNRLDQNRNTSLHIIIKTPNALGLARGQRGTREADWEESVCSGESSWPQGEPSGVCFRI